MTLETLNSRLTGKATVAWYPEQKGAKLGVVFAGTEKVYLYRQLRYVWELAENLEEKLGLHILDRCHHGAIIRNPDRPSCEECNQAQYAAAPDDDWV